MLQGIRKLQEYFDRGLQWLLPDEGVLFNDDLDAAGEILCDTSGQKFQERISRVFLYSVQREALALDESQARLALRLGSSHQIIKDLPGHLQELRASCLMEPARNQDWQRKAFHLINDNLPDRPPYSPL